MEAVKRIDALFGEIIGLKLALGQAAAYFVQWTIIGTVISLIDKPLATP